MTPQNVAQDNLAGTVSLVNIGTIPLGTNVTAYDRLPNGDQLLAFDTTVSLPGGVTARPGAVEAHGVADLLLSFDTSGTVGGSDQPGTASSRTGVRKQLATCRP